MDPRSRSSYTAERFDLLSWLTLLRQLGHLTYETRRLIIMTYSQNEEELLTISPLNSFLLKIVLRIIVS
jgi:hypothetical protein